MITFKQQITVSEELVNALALELGYQPILTRQITVTDDETTDPITTHTETEEYPNPQTSDEYVDEKAKQHTINFFKPFGDKLVAQELEKLGFEQQKAIAKKTLEEQIINPIVESLSTVVETE